MVGLSWLKKRNVKGKGRKYDMVKKRPWKENKLIVKYEYKIVLFVC